MNFEDKTLFCGDCQQSFTFTTGEQEFYASKQLANEPKRCHNCRVLMKVKRSGKDEETTTEVNCADCGTATRVPFKPSGYKPVYCSACFNLKKGDAPATVTASSGASAHSPSLLAV